ncbi:hypothetical protein HMPREF3039_02752 [Akkermansia sp. KLE1798]|nr:hypothetical protein HMPREF3039_02752 [Akkermansia sp. KLE1798]
MAMVGRVQFQSTPSLRRATQGSLLMMTVRTVSIHALLAESDCNHN